MKVEGGEVGIKVEGEASWNLDACTITDSRVSFLFSFDGLYWPPQIGLEVTGRSKGRMSNTLVEGCSVGIDVVTGARVDILSGSRSRKLHSCFMQHYI